MVMLLLLLFVCCLSCYQYQQLAQLLNHCWLDQVMDHIQQRRSAAAATQSRSCTRLLLELQTWNVIDLIKVQNQMNPTHVLWTMQ
jgi:hypothetical protein